MDEEELQRALEEQQEEDRRLADELERELHRGG